MNAAHDDLSRAGAAAQSENLYGSVFVLTAHVIVVGRAWSRVRHQRRRCGPPRGIGAQPRRGGRIPAWGTAPTARRPGRRRRDLGKTDVTFHDDLSRAGAAAQSENLYGSVFVLTAHVIVVGRAWSRVRHQRRRRDPPRGIGPQPRRGGRIPARGAAPTARRPGRRRRTVRKSVWISVRPHGARHRGWSCVVARPSSAPKVRSTAGNRPAASKRRSHPSPGRSADGASPRATPARSGKGWGKPVFAGTRIPVDLILERIASGETLESILESHPRLTREAILASFAFVSHWMRSDVVYPVPANA
jgi:uncharacterized protein (DUF433 family)